MTRLLDVNVLIALLDKNHAHCSTARHWFKHVRSGAWATCPLTENGFLRIVSSRAYRARSIGIGTAIETLRALCDHPEFEFWPDDVSIRTLLTGPSLVTNAQISDVYLLGLAIHHGGKLVTFDRGIPVHAVIGGDDAVELISLDHGGR